MPIVTETALPGARRLLVVEGDLLREPVDAIVNAANGHLAHGGGVAAVISRAAGSSLDQEGRAYVREHGPVPVGGAVVTTAGALAFEGVIHAVGPRYGEGAEEEKLAEAVGSALLRASERGWRSVSFPAVSSGIFGVPLEICARAYVRGVRDHIRVCPDSSVTEVRICLLPGSPLVALMEELLASDEEATG